MTQIQQIKNRQSMDYWKQVILAQQQSGLKAREYCRQQYIKYNAFYYWLRKIVSTSRDSVFNQQCSYGIM